MSELPQLVCGPDTRQGEDVRRTYGAGTEDHLLAIDRELLVTADCAHPYRPMALEHDPADETVGSYGQSRSISSWVEVTYCRAHTHAAVDVEGQGPYAR